MVFHLLAYVPLVLVVALAAGVWWVFDRFGKSLREPWRNRRD
jgi:hypothetical protein